MFAPPLVAFILQQAFYLSAITHAADSATVWAMGFFDGDAISLGKDDNNRLAWCVRGGPVVDPQ
jgi:hypothetical protein